MSPTQFIDILAALMPMLVCGYAIVKCLRSGRRTGLAVILILVEAALLLDAIFNLRWRLHDLLGAKASQLNLYSQRSAPQVIAVTLIVAVAGVAVAIGLWHLRRRPGAALAVSGATLSVATWSVEVISLHAVDALLYRTVHGIMRVSLIWIIGSMMTSVGVLQDMRTRASAH